MDSRNDYSASAESMDCHATASAVSRNDDKNADSSVDCHADKSARNDRKKAAFSKVDSSSTATHSHCELCESKAWQSTNQKWILGETPQM